VTLSAGCAKLDPVVDSVLGERSILGERMARQGLVDRPARTVVEAVALSGGVQAQDLAAGRLGIRARARGLTDAEVTWALQVDRSVVRTSVMRSTLHLVAAEDACWLARLFGPVIRSSFATRWRGIGLDERLLTRTAEALPEILSAEPMTRPEIVDALARRRLRVPQTDPYAPSHVMLHAVAHGLACRGPDRGREPTFVALCEWIAAGEAAVQPRQLDGDDALAELARRYFRAFSPATGTDFTTWSGLPSRRAIDLIRDELTPVEIGGRPGYRLGEPGRSGAVRLLPRFDNYVIGYRAREQMIAAEHVSAVYVGGVIKATVVVDGRIAGTWRLDPSGRNELAVRVQPFATLPPKVVRELTTDVRDIAAFLDRPVDLTVAEPDA
jgi:winged helix DNA-binding protein